MRTHDRMAEPAEIEIEVGVHGREVVRFDANGGGAFVQPGRCGEPGRVVVSSVKRVMVSSAVATRVARRRNGDSACRCCAVKRAPSRASLRKRSG